MLEFMCVFVKAFEEEHSFHRLGYRGQGLGFSISHRSSAVILCKLFKGPLGFT